MTDEEIIKACLAKIPVGNIRVHTKENLPQMVDEYVVECIKAKDILEHIFDRIEGWQYEQNCSNILLVLKRLQEQYESDD